MAADGRLGGVLEAERTNAAVAWALAGVVVVAAAGSAVEGDFLWAGFALAVLALVLLPPAAYRRASVMLPWEVLAVAVLPVLGRVFATLSLTSQFATYLSVAAIALIVAVELHVFTPVEMTAGFAVLFVAVATLATAGVWAVVRWVVDVSLGTAFLLDPALSHAVVERQLMWEFVYSTAAGIVGGVIFELYFRRRGRGRRPARGRAER